MENKDKTAVVHALNAQQRAAHYATIALQTTGLMEGEADNPVGILANVAALLKEAFDYYFWVGFYIVRRGQLQLGPFQGPLACLNISHGRGVCGTAWAEKRTLLVPDVEAFPGHIACSSRSRSEIVVPILRGGEVVAVIDVDSTTLDAFHEADQVGLEALAQQLSQLFPLPKS